jgi:hypothetical protein
MQFKIIIMCMHHCIPPRVTKLAYTPRSSSYIAYIDTYYNNIIMIIIDTRALALQALGTEWTRIQVTTTVHCSYRQQCTRELVMQVTIQAHTL